MRLERLEGTASVGELTAVLDEHGVVIVNNLISESTVSRLAGELAPFLARPTATNTFVNDAVASFFGPHTNHVMGVAAKSPTFVSEVLCHPTLLRACDGVLGPSCARYQLNVAHVLDRGPGAEQQTCHRDEDTWIHVPRPHPELQLASVVALDPFTASNGATRIVPGSHRWERGRIPDQDDFLVAEMDAGSAVIYLGSVLHAGGANVTARCRRGMHLSYVVGWLRTEENHYLAAPPAAVSAMPRCAQELLGYAVHDAIDAMGGYLGVVDLHDPISLLEAGAL